MPSDEGKLTRRQAFRGLGLVAAGAVAGKAAGMFGGGSGAIAGQTTHRPDLGKHGNLAHRGGAGAHEVMHGSVAAVSAPANALDPLTYPPPPQKARRGRVREYELVAEETDIEVAKGVTYPAWTYNGTAPGPVIRATEGDLLRVKLDNASKHPHTIHFHGIHPANMDGVFEIVEPGDSFLYEFEALPAGMQVYHCHTPPLKKHIEKGLYGAFIIDPKKPRKPAQEIVMVMNGFDTDGDGENNFYTVNGVAFFFAKYPIKVRRNTTVRIYLANLTEFDPINSFHLHGEFFRYYPTGTREQHYLYTDMVQLAQGERGIIEIDFTYTGRFMFHAHQTELADLGWMGFFDVVD